MKNYRKYILHLIYLVVAILIVNTGLSFGSEIALGSDGFFHYGRFEYLFTQTGKGNFFNDFYTDGFLKEMGYPIGTFYPQALFYPFVLLGRILSLNAPDAFRLMLVSFIFLLLTSTRWAILRFYRKSPVDNLNRIAVVGSFLYLMLPPLAVFDFQIPLTSYFLINLWIRHSFSELVAAIFIPWVIVGLREIFDEERPDCTVLLISLVGILYSHVLTGLLIGGVVFIGYLLYVRRVMSSRLIMKESMKMLILFLLLGAYQIFPMLEMMRFQDYLYNNPAFNPGTLLSRAVPFLGFDSMPWFILIFQIALGMRLTIGLIRTKETIQRMIVAGILGLYLSSILFPWQLLNESPMSIIQFPFRFLFLPNLFLSFTLPVYLFRLRIRTRNVILALLPVFLLLNLYMFHSTGYIESLTPLSFINDASETNLFIGAGGEYLPGNITVAGDEFSDEYGFTMDYTDNKTDELLSLAKENDHLLPKFYHKGYIIKKGNELVRYKRGPEGLIQTEMPGKDDEFILERKRTIVQNLSFGISLLSLVLLSTHLIKTRKLRAC